MFSLGESPYPDLEAGPQFFSAILNDKIRLPKPVLAPEEIFEQIVMRCWEEEPTERLHFEQGQKIYFKTFLLQLMTQIVLTWPL